MPHDTETEEGELNGNGKTRTEPTLGRVPDLMHKETEPTLTAAIEDISVRVDPIGEMSESQEDWGDYAKRVDQIAKLMEENEASQEGKDMVVQFVSALENAPEGLVGALRVLDNDSLAKHQISMLAATMIHDEIKRRDQAEEESIHRQHAKEIEASHADVLPSIAETVETEAPAQSNETSPSSPPVVEAEDIKTSPQPAQSTSQSVQEINGKRVLKSLADLGSFRSEVITVPQPVAPPLPPETETLPTPIQEQKEQLPLPSPEPKKAEVSEDPEKNKERAIVELNALGKEISDLKKVLRECKEDKNTGTEEPRHSPEEEQQMARKINRMRSEAQRLAFKVASPDALFEIVKISDQILLSSRKRYADHTPEEKKEFRETKSRAKKFRELLPGVDEHMSSDLYREFLRHALELEDRPQTERRSGKESLITRLSKLKEGEQPQLSSADQHLIRWYGAKGTPKKILATLESRRKSHLTLPQESEKMTPPIEVSEPQNLREVSWEILEEKAKDPDEAVRILAEEEWERRELDSNKANRRSGLLKSILEAVKAGHGATVPEKLLLEFGKIPVISRYLLLRPQNEIKLPLQEQVLPLPLPPLPAELVVEGLSEETAAEETNEEKNIVLPPPEKILSLINEGKTDLQKEHWPVINALMNSSDAQLQSLGETEWNRRMERSRKLADKKHLRGALENVLGTIERGYVFEARNPQDESFINWLGKFKNVPAVARYLRDHPLPRESFKAIEQALDNTGDVYKKRNEYASESAFEAREWAAKNAAVKAVTPPVQEQAPLPEVKEPAAPPEEHVPSPQEIITPNLDTIPVLGDAYWDAFGAHWTPPQKKKFDDMAAKFSLEQEEEKVKEEVEAPAPESDAYWSAFEASRSNKDNPVSEGINGMQNTTPAKEDIPVLSDAVKESGNNPEKIAEAAPPLPINPEVVKKFEENFKGITGAQLERISGFTALTPGQQLLTLKNLQSMVLDHVKSDARVAQHEEWRDTHALKRFWGQLTNFGMKKEKRIAELEKEYAQQNKLGDVNTPEGRRMLADNIAALEDLVKVAAEGPDVEVAPDGRLAIIYLSKSKFPEIDGGKPLNLEQMKIIERFNKAADQYAKFPHEWSYEVDESRVGFFEKFSKERKEYRKAQFEYYAAREMLTGFYFNRARERGESDPERAADMEMNQMDERVELNQLFNTHPDVEKALLQIEDQSATEIAVKEFWKAKGLFMLYGAATRAAVVAVTGGLVAPILAAVGVGGITGAGIGRAEAKSIIKQRRSDGRMSEEDLREEIEYKVYKKDAANKTETDGNGDPVVLRTEKRQMKEYTDAIFFTDRIERLSLKLEQSKDAAERELLEKKIMQTVTVMREKNSRGMINFGGSELEVGDSRKGTTILNRLNFIQALARGDVETVIDRDAFAEKIEKAAGLHQATIEKKRKEDINDAVLKSVVIRGGFALAGALIAEGFSMYGHDAPAVVHHHGPAPKLPDMEKAGEIVRSPQVLEHPAPQSSAPVQSLHARLGHGALPPNPDTPPVIVPRSVPVEVPQTVVPAETPSQLPSVD